MDIQDDFEGDVMTNTTASLKEFEKMVMQSIIFNEEFATNTIDHIQPEFFEDQAYIHIFSTIKTFYKNNINNQYSIPKIDILKVIIKQDKNILKIYNNDLTDIFKNINDLYTYQQLDEKWIIENTQTWLKRNKITSTMFEIFDKLQNSKTKLEKTNSVDELLPILEESINIDLSPPKIFDVSDFSNVEKIVKKLSLGVDLVKPSIKTIVDVAGENLQRGMVNIVVGATGSGKSIHLETIYKSVIDNGFNALYVSYELNQDIFFQRYMANIYNTNIGSFRDKSMESADNFNTMLRKKHDEIYKNRRGQGFFLRANDLTASVKEVSIYLKNLQKIKNIKIDCVIFDYLGKMKPSYVTNRNARSDENLVAVANEMEDFASSNNLLVWTAMQLKPDSKQNEYLTDSDIASSKYILQPMSFGYAFQQKDGLHKCFTLKCRNGELKPVFVLGVDYKYQRIYDIDQSNLDMQVEDVNILKAINQRDESKKDLKTKINVVKTPMKAFNLKF
jgi:replicative DNA helicase